MTCPHLLARIDDAEARLARVSAETGGHGVEALWLDEPARYDPAAVPDAFYVNRGDPYVSTLIYDVAQGRVSHARLGRLARNAGSCPGGSSISINNDRSEP